MTILLNVDLEQLNIEKKCISHLRKNFLGGVGINTKLLYDLLPHGTDPLEPENVLIFGAGSLVGSGLPTACRTEVTSKSPLSGLFGTANAGDKWGTKLRRAGIDNIVITGRSEKPVYIVIDNDDIELKSADELWGMDCYETTKELLHIHGSDFCIASIGPAGENLVRFASIQNDYYGAWGRTGIGAVMGSKNLKAIAVRGNKKIEAVDKQTLKQLKKEALTRIKEDPSFGPTRKYGSMITSDPFNQLGALPGFNFKSGSISNWEETLGRKVFAENYKEKDMACISCPVACAHWSKIKEFETKGLEITFAMEFGAKLGISKIPEIYKCVDVCNKYGMDVVSAAGTVAYLISSYKEGFFTKNEIGFSVDFGDFDAIHRLLKLIGSRHGIGDLLAEGTKLISKKHPETAKNAFHVKGIELPGRDPRAKMDVWSLGYLTNTRGGDHLRARSPVERLKGKLKDDLTEELGISSEEVEGLDIPAEEKEKIFGNPPQGVNIPAMTVYAENLITIINSVGFCIRPPILRTLGPDYYARSMNAFYGDDFTEHGLYSAAKEIYDLQHHFNSREGGQLKSEDFLFPDSFYNESLTAKEKTHPPLDPKKIERMIKKYLEYRDLH